MRKVIAVALVAVGLVLVTPPDTASASTGCVTRHEFNEVRQSYNYGSPFYGVPRHEVRAIFGTPGQRIAYDPSGGAFFGPLHGLLEPGGSGAELRAFRTCPAGGAAWIGFWRLGDGGHWLTAFRIGPNRNSYPAMWWFS